MAVGFDIDSFRSNFKEGARAYLFYFKPNIPIPGFDMEQATYMVRATNLPEEMFEDIIVPYQGLDYKMAGKRTFAPLTVTFNVDAKADIHSWFVRWVDAINHPVTNVSAPPIVYMQDQTLELLDIEGNVIKTYKLVAAFPGSIGAAALGYDQVEILQFDVEFRYQYHIMY